MDLTHNIKETKPPAVSKLAGWHPYKKGFSGETFCTLNFFLILTGKAFLAVEPIPMVDGSALLCGLSLRQLYG